MRPFPLVLPMLVGLLQGSAPSAMGPAALATGEACERALLIVDSSIDVPTPAQTSPAPPTSAAPQGTAFASERDEAVVADFDAQTRYRVPLGAPATTAGVGT